LISPPGPQQHGGATFGGHDAVVGIQVVVGAARGVEHLAQQAGQSVGAEAGQVVVRARPARRVR
jgi:hypothetical protein